MSATVGHTPPLLAATDEESPEKKPLAENEVGVEPAQQQLSVDCGVRDTRPDSSSNSANAGLINRLGCLDELRGITMATMVFVDMVGEAFPGIGHSPWNKVHLADFVMPFFLFTCGVSISIAFKNLENRRAAIIRKVLWRCSMLFFIGILIQGGWFGTYSLDLSTFRIMGILQRIAVAYGVAVLIKVFVPTCPVNCASQPSRGQCLDIWLFSRYSLQWIASSSFLVIYLIIVHCVRVPRTGCNAADWMDGLNFRCNVAGWIDTTILTSAHMYRQDSTDKSLGFDPEGLVTTLGCIFTVYVGVHVGHAHLQIGSAEPFRCIRHWLLLACTILVLTVAFVLLVPFNKRMWSLSYNFLTVGCACMCLILLRSLEIVALPQSQQIASDQPERRAAIDIAHTLARAIKIALTPLRWLGTNAMLFFVFSDSGNVANLLVRSIYNKRPENNIVTWFQVDVLIGWLGLQCPGWTKAHPVPGGINECSMILVYSIIEICVWCCICGVLYRKRIFWKI